MPLETKLTDSERSAEFAVVQEIVQQVSKWLGERKVTKGQAVLVFSLLLQDAARQSDLLFRLNVLQACSETMTSICEESLSGNSTRTH